jgi:hypothetical protein
VSSPSWLPYKETRLLIITLYLTSVLLVCSDYYTQAVIVSHLLCSLVMSIRQNLPHHPLLCFAFLYQVAADTLFIALSFLLSPIAYPIDPCQTEEVPPMLIDESLGYLLTYGGSCLSTSSVVQNTLLIFTLTITLEPLTLAGPMISMSSLWARGISCSVRYIFRLITRSINTLPGSDQDPWNHSLRFEE